MTTTNISTSRPRSWDRVGALSGAAYVILILVGNTLATAGEGGDAHPTGAAVLADVSHDVGSTSAQLGIALELLGFVAMAFFVGWFSDLLRRSPAAPRWLGTTALIGGLTTLAVKIASIMPMAALVLDRQGMSPDIARLLNDMNGAAFVVTFMTFGVFMLASGLSLLCSGILGKVTAWSAVVIGAAGVLLTVVTRVDPLDTNPIPFLLGIVWVLVVSIRVAVRAPRTVTYASPAPAAVSV